MSRNYTVQEIIDRGLRRAEFSGSNYVPLQEQLDYLNEANAELRELLFGVAGGHYFLTSSTLTSVGSSQIALPDDFLRMSWVDLQRGDKFYRIPRFTVPERNISRNSTGINSYGPAQFAYRTIGTSEILFYPQPPAGTTFIINYSPRAPIYTTAQLTSTIDGINGFETFIVDTLALKFLEKEGIEFEKISRLKNHRDEQRRRVEQNAELYDAGEPERMSLFNSWSPYDFWGDL